MRTSLLPLLLAGAALAALPVAVSAQGYRIDTLSLNGSTDVSPTGIAGGYVVGNTYTDTGLVSGIWGPTGSRVLSVPAGASNLGVQGVNRLGVAVGGSGTRGMVWGTDGALTYLPSTDGDGDTLYGSGARRINDAGTIIGFGETGFGRNGVVWSGTDIRILRSLNPSAENERTSANAINASGLIAGSASDDEFGNSNRAVTWSADGTIRALPGLGDYSAAYGVNDRGVAVGYGLNANGDAQAFVNAGGASIFLPILAGALDGSANAINNAGLIVGSSSEPVTYEGIATLWQNGQAIDLNSLLGAEAPDWRLISATGIDDDGTIVGFGLYRGVNSSFRLAPVPEPATLVALGLGLAALARRRKTRRA